MEKLLKEVGLLEEFKFANFSEKEALKDKILDLEHQIGFLKEQNDKMTALPLQSFNHTPRRNYPHSTDTLHSQQAPK